MWQYDALGNATRLRGPQGMLALDFARNGTLSSLSVNGQAWTYTYDGLGRRITKTNGQVVWHYAWLEGRLVGETYQANPQAESVVRQYIYHPDSYTPVAFVEGGQLYTLLADNRGAVTHAFDSRGTLVWQGEYSAFGSCKEVVGQVRQSFRLAGQYADGESGLHYNVGRYYAPFVGQYLSLDPQWLDHADTHPYAYGRQDPYNRHDPLGDIAPLLIIGGAALISGGISAGVKAYQGGSWRQIGAAFVRGSLSGAGAAVGAMAGGLPGMVAGAMVGEFAGALAEQAINGDELCLSCAATDALIAGGFALGLGVLGGLLGRGLANTPIGRSIAEGLANSRVGRAIAGALEGAARDLDDAVNGLRRGTGGLSPAGAGDVSPAGIGRGGVPESPPATPPTGGGGSAIGSAADNVPPWRGPADYSNLPPGRRVEPGGEYTPAQKRRIYEANREHNEGVLRSDQDGTVLEMPQKSQRGVTPSPNEAQVDHNYPRSQGGANSNENARVLSREQNRTKSDNIPPGS